MSDFKRVYHPTADAWQDVPTGDVEDWSKAGWLKTKPKHVDDSEAHELGTFHVAEVAYDASGDLAPGVDTVVNQTGKSGTVVASK